MHPVLLVAYACVVVYSIGVFACFVGWIRLLLRRYPLVPSAYPTVSVVVALRDEHDHVDDLLTALMAQNYPNVEFLLVDDHSTDATVRLLRQWESRGNVRVICACGKGKKAALHEGIAAARGTWVALTDADCTMPPTWVSSLVASALTQQASMVIGPVRSRGNWFYELDQLSLVGVTMGSAAWGKPVLCSGANLLVKREVWLLADLCEKQASGDDMFMMSSLKASGYRIVPTIARDALVTTCAPASLRQFMDQHARWLSKSPSYRDGAVLGVLLLVGITLLMMLGSLLLCCFGVWEAMWLWVPVSVADALLLAVVAYSLGQARTMICFVPAQLGYPLYAFAVHLWRKTRVIKWKNRTI